MILLPLLFFYFATVANQYDDGIYREPQCVDEQD